MRPDRRTWRIRGIPRDINRELLARALRRHSDLQWPRGDAVENFENGGNDVIINTLAPDLRANYQVATVRFRDLPSQLQALGARDELNIKIQISPEDPASEVLVDEHFDGITTLFSPVTDEEHQIDILAVSGLGSHPFGSFVNKKDGNMWLTNNLPRDMPAARVMIFGYESRLHNSSSQIELDDLAGPVHIAISQISQSRGRPLLLIGHSLGGLLVKEALIRSAESGLENGLPNPLDMIMGILLFGTPNDGLDIESLVPMVNDQPNRSLLESLRSTGSQMLGRQRKDFSKILERTKLQIFCLYETELSPTASQDSETREWKMGGPLRFLVSKPSATSCLPAGAPSTRSVPIRRNHSDLVKFSSHDAEYDKVAYILSQVKEISASDKTQEKEPQFPAAIREPQNGTSIIGQHRRVTGDTQLHNLVKRPADDLLPPSADKRPRTASSSPENSRYQAGEDPALHHSELRDEMRDVKEELIRRLYFSKIDERLTHLAPAQGTTCRWFLTELKYQSWQNVARQSEHGGFLWIKGHPGTGKSTLMKYLFQDTKDKAQNDPLRITLSFFFLARGTSEEKTTTGLYRSLLHQLFEIAPDLKQSLVWMTGDGARTIERNGWSEEALKQTLKYAVPKLGKRSLTMFVDALDECDENKANDMVSFFEELCDCATEAKVDLRICFSSRHYPTVVIDKGLEVYLEDENGHTEDIRKYVKSRLRLKSKAKNTEALRSEIQEKSSGIFLWVVLVLDILNNEKSMSTQKLREHLRGIPPGLDDIFRMIIGRDGEDLEQLQLCLNWILFSSYPLKPQELYFAIQFGSNDECSGFWDESDLDLNDMKAFVRSSSKGLAEVTRNKASEVQFIHESVRDFLLGKYGNQWSGTSGNLEGHGHRVLRDCCLAQLNASISEEIEIPDPLPKASLAKQMRDEIHLKFPFLQYSVRNILHHSNLAQRNGIKQGRFLSDFPLRRWVHLSNILERYDVRRYTDSVSLLYILGENNLGELIRIHPSRKLCFKVVDFQRYGAPILAAFARNSRESVRAFLWAWAENEPPTSPLCGLCEQYEQNGNNPSRVGRDFNFDFSGRGPLRVLYDLIEKDEETAALAFVLGPYNLSDDPNLIKPLRLAIDGGHEALVKVLLKKVAHFDKNQVWLDSRLIQAARRGSEALVRMLFDIDANSQPSRQGLQQALCGAAENGHLGVVKLLLKKGADIDSKNDSGESALSLAAQHGKQSAVFNFLLWNGAEIESRDKAGRTPLTRAAGSSCFDNVKLLLDKGADIESRDGNDRTPLSWAAANHTPSFAIVKLLLDKGADLESRDRNGRTPLSWAARHDTEAILVKLFLENGADVEIADKDGLTPLAWAAIGANFYAVALLLEKGAAVDSKDKEGRTPLSLALLNQWIPGSARVISLLEKAASGIKRKENAEDGLLILKRPSDVAL